MGERAKFMEGRDGVSDSIYSQMRDAHDAANRALNSQDNSVTPNIVPGSSYDNLGYRVQPGRKSGIFSDKG